MANKMPIAVLISGSGRTLKNLLDRVAAGTLDVDIRLVVSSSPNAYGLKYAEEADIPTLVVERSAYETPEAFSRAVFLPCRRAFVKYVVLAGYLKLLPIPDDFQYRVLNIHPSLIPAFCGKGFYGHAVHQAAIDRGVKVSGCTVHYADNEFDHGPIILQKAVAVKDDDTADTLSDRILNEAEFDAYPEALQLLAENRVKLVSIKGSDRCKVEIL